MKMKVSVQQVDNLKLDAKTLVDISRLLEMDGRFRAMPGILRGIADDIQEVLNGEAIDRARVHEHEPNA